MCKIRLIALFLFFFVLAGSAYELRTWEDLDGNQYRGRFLRELFDKLTVETEDGDRKVFKLEDLSELDKKYLRVMVPPEIEVEVRTKSKSIDPPPITMFSPKAYIREDYQVDVAITKKSQRPFTSRLKAEIFLIAEEVSGSNFILLGRSERDFLMPTSSKGAEIELKSDVERTTKFRDAYVETMRGEEWAGYLLVISTLQDEIVLMDSNLPSWVEDRSVVKNLRELSIAGAPSARSRHFDETGKKVPPPRPSWRAPNVK